MSLTPQTSFTAYCNRYNMQGQHQQGSKKQILHEWFTTSNLIDLQHYSHSQIFKDTIYPWQVIPHITKYAQDYISHVAQQERQKGTIVGSVHIDQNVIIGTGTVIQHGAMIKGPAIIGANCQIRKGAYIRGNVVVGDECMIGNSTQLKNCVLLDKVQVCHFNYVGDSVLGEGAHFAAGAITSNLKLDQNQVFVRTQNKSLATGLKKFGAIVGDYCQVGCNVVLNPGSILGRRCVIYPGAMIRGVVKGGHIMKVVQEQIVVAKK